MRDFLFIYALLPVVYFMHRAGEIACEKGRVPLRWQIGAYLAVLFGGCLFPFVALITGLANDESLLTLSLLYLAGVLIAGFGFLSVFNRKKPLAGDKRVYRAFDLKNAFLFPSVIPRGGFLWRYLLYTILLYLAVGIIQLASPLFQESLALTLAVYVLFIAAICFALLYYISFICIPRIRDAGLSRDTLILLFIPGLCLVALVMLFTTPTRISRRSSI